MGSSCLGAIPEIVVNVPALQVFSLPATRGGIGPEWELLAPKRAMQGSWPRACALALTLMTSCHPMAGDGEVVDLGGDTFGTVTPDNNLAVA